MLIGRVQAMLKVNSDVMYNDKTYMTMLLGKTVVNDNASRLKFLKSAVFNCINNSLTDRQRQYLEMYYFKAMTISQIAKEFGVSKSTVHKDITENLQRSNKLLYSDVKTILEQNKNERHIRGGEATKQKFLKIKQIK